MKIQFVRCNANHLEMLMTIAHKTYLQHYTYLWHDDGVAYVKAEFHKEALGKQLLDDLSEFYLVKQVSETIGYLKLQMHSSLPGYPPENCLEIQRVYLLEEYVGKQLGSYIFKTIEGIALTKNISVLWLLVMDSSKAKSFYLKNGYQELHKTSLDRPHIKEEFRQMRVMIKQL